MAWEKGDFQIGKTNFEYTQQIKVLFTTWIAGPRLQQGLTVKIKCKCIYDIENTIELKMLHSRNWLIDSVAHFPYTSYERVKAGWL